MKKTLYLILTIIFIPLIVVGYTIRKNDILGVWVFGYSEYSSSNLIVGPDGSITLPPIGRIQVEGKTLEVIEKEVSEKISNYINTTNITIGVVNYAPYKLNILGEIKKNGLIDIQKSKMPLSELIALCGGLNDPINSSKVIIKYPDKTEKIVNMAWLYNGQKGEDPIVTENSYVLIPFDSKNKINIFSDSNTYSINYSEGMTLKDIISNLNLNLNSISNDITILRENKKFVVDLDKIIKEKDFSLLKSDTIIFDSVEKNIFVVSNLVSKKVSFEKDENMTFEMLFVKLGLDPNSIENVFVNNKQESKTYTLKNNDFIKIEFYNKYVYVFTNNTSNKVKFENYENMNTEVLLTKINLTKNLVEKIYRNNKEISIETELFSGDSIRIELKKNNVYLNGAFNSLGNISFAPNEKITFLKLLSTCKGFKNNFSGRLIIIDKSGNSNEKFLDLNNIYKEDFEIQPGSTLIASEETNLAYIFGDVSSMVNYESGSSLYEILIKYNLNNSYNIEFEANNKKYSFNYSDIDNYKDFILNGKVFIKIEKMFFDKVSIYKLGNLKTLSEEKITIYDALYSMNGFSPSKDGKMFVYNKNKLISTFEFEDIIKNPLTEIPKGSYVVIQPETENDYITVISNQRTHNVRTDIPVSILNLLNNVSIDWTIENNITIYSPKNEKNDLTLKDIDNLKTIMIQPGSIVYFHPTTNQLVYVFGNVLRPGTIKFSKDMKVLDAIFKAGNISKKAELSTVYLFQNGPENPPKILDLSGIVNYSNIDSSMNTIIKPGDIVFVPQNGFSNLMDIMSTVSTFMDFFNSSTKTITNVQNLFK